MGGEPWFHVAPYQAEDFWEDIGRGEAVCVVLYSGDRPSELYFAGYSFD